MDKHSTAAASRPTLLSTLLCLLVAHRPAFKQDRPFRRALALALGEVMALARHTITQDLLALGLGQGDWTAFYRLFSRERFCVKTLGRCLLRETLVHALPTEPYVVGIDTTQMRRHSLKLPGTSWWRAAGTAAFQRGLQRGQRFLHGAWLAPIEHGYSRAVSLRLLPAFPAKAVASIAEACPEWAAGLAFVEWVRRELDAAGRQEQRLLVLADGAYDCLKFWRGLPIGCVAVVRTARNRRLRQLRPTSAKPDGRRKYGEVAPTPAAWLKERAGWLRTTVAVRGRDIGLRYRVEGPYLRQGAPNYPLWLIVVGGAEWRAGKKEPRRARRDPTFYLVSAVQVEGEWRLPLPIETLLAWTWQRWELEVAHREMKSSLGVGDKQCWNQRSAVVAVQWSVWLYGVLVLAGYRAWGLFGGPPTPARWWGGARRWSFTTLWRAYRREIWGHDPIRPLWSPTTTDWPTSEAWEAGMRHAVAAAARA